MPFIIFSLFVFSRFVCSVSGFCAEHVANLWSLIDMVGSFRGNGEKEAF